MASFAQSLLDWVIYLVVLPVFKFSQRLIWSINGVKASRDKAASGSNYDQSVQVLKVIWGKKMSHMKPSDDSEFLTFHERFDNPSILKDPSISLYGLTLTEAVFVKTKSDVDIFSSDTHPFMKWAQGNNVLMVYTLPICAFHRFAEELGDPSLPVIWISSIGRCGSTLLGQVFEKIPGTISLGEPDAVNAVTIADKSEKVTKEEARRLLQSVIRVQCRTLPGAQRIVLKVAAFTFAEVKDICNLFPKIRHLFLYRDMIPYAKSCKTMLESEFQTRIMSKFFKWMMPFKREMYKGFVRIDREDHFMDDLALGYGFIGLWTILAVAIIKRYVEFKKQGIPIFAVLYEDLIAEKETMVRKLFVNLDIPERHVTQGVSAFQVDSQRGSSFKRKEKKNDLDPSELKEVNEVLAKYGFPLCGERIDVPGRLMP